MSDREFNLDMAKHALGVSESKRHVCPLGIHSGHTVAMSLLGNQAGSEHKLKGLF